MKNTTFTAKLISENQIRITIFSSITKPDNYLINIIKDNIEIKPLKIEKFSLMGNIAVYDCSVPFSIDLGHFYDVVIEAFGSCALDVNDATTFTNFDEKFFYGANDLGANWQKDYTEFVLWAPLACSVLLKISVDEGKSWVFYEMERETKGVYRLKLNGNFDGAYYNYFINNSGVSKLTLDPYGKGSTANAKNSVVINFKKIKIDLEDENLPKYENYTDTIIYETHVRDFTISPATNIQNKGVFLGLSEEHRTTKGGHPAGLDYLKFLGITHLQLLPIYDYKTVDETNTKTTYNWGYDPQQFFVPEGGFASDVSDPYSRIIDLKKMVKALHHNKIKVVMDVVYNHVFDYQFSIFEDVVPNYYFRRNINGIMSNGSFCGNDIATEKKMVSKMIIDACSFWIKEYGIDGFRFDLMGIIDKYTIMKIYRDATLVKSDFIIYGEGWNMPTVLDDSIKTSTNNALVLPHIGFFNETFRDIVKGPTAECDFQVPGYLTGDLSYRDGFKFAYLASILSRTFPKKFLNANQSLNYVECHDNATLFDKIVSSTDIENENDIMRVLKMCNATVLLSFGIPFIHAGQEIGQSKNMHQNTYNTGDKYNMFRYDLLDARFDSANYLKTLIEFRKYFSCLHDFRPEVIAEDGEFVDLKNGGLMLVFANKTNLRCVKNLQIIYNPTDEPYYHEFDVEKRLIISDAGCNIKSDLVVKNATVPAYSIFGYVDVEE
ncbi:MAG: type I pullulanase [Bacilli bacterium]